MRSAIGAIYERFAGTSADEILQPGLASGKPKHKARLSEPSSRYTFDDKNAQIYLQAIPNIKSPDSSGYGQAKLCIAGAGSWEGDWAVNHRIQ